VQIFDAASATRQGSKCEISKDVVTCKLGYGTRT